MRPVSNQSIGLNGDSGRKKCRDPKLGAARTPVSGSIRTIERSCQAVGKEGRITHHRQRLYPSPVKRVGEESDVSTTKRGCTECSRKRWRRWIVCLGQRAIGYWARRYGISPAVTQEEAATQLGSFQFDHRFADSGLCAAKARFPVRGQPGTLSLSAGTGKRSRERNWRKRRFSMCFSPQTVHRSGRPDRGLVPTARPGE